MTTTMVNQIQIEEQLKEAGIRGQVKTMVVAPPLLRTGLTRSAQTSMGGKVPQMSSAR